MILMLMAMYIYIRILYNSAIYVINIDTRKEDPKLEQLRCNLMHSTAVQLEKSQSIITAGTLGI